MRAASWFRAVVLTGSALASSSLLANTPHQVLLTRGQAPESGELKGVVELTVDPGLDEAKVSVTMDGQQVADGLRSPYKLTVDFGPAAIEHNIGVTAVSNGRRVQWHETVNRGHRALTVKVQPVDLPNHLFEAVTTAPDEDPIASVTLWDNGVQIAQVTSAPYRFTVPGSAITAGFVQVTALTKSGDEAADFWSPGGDVHVATLDVRTVPLFVSVVDANGNTLDNVHPDMFRIIDNNTEGKIVEFGKAFDQPISIALLVDASASMTYEMKNATTAATNFVERTLKPGDRCAVFAVRDVPRRMQELTADKAAVQQALTKIEAGGDTALYDSVEAAIRELKNEKNRRALVVLTDGGDTSSIASFAELDRVATEAGIPMYFIVYDTGGSALSTETDRLNYLAGQTGGFVAVANAEQRNLPAKYAAIERDLRAQFAIRYQVSDFAKHNEWRKVRVVVNSPKLTARTIRGYYAP